MWTYIIWIEVITMVYLMCLHLKTLWKHETSGMSAWLMSNGNESFLEFLVKNVIWRISFFGVKLVFVGDLFRSKRKKKHIFDGI